MKEININDGKDELWIKLMMEAAKKEPSDNLSYRIMHQIETEEALTRSKSKVSKQKRKPID